MGTLVVHKNQKVMPDKITEAYKLSENIYDDVLMQRSFLSKLYISLFWGVDDNEIAEKVLSMIPDDFSGRLLDVPVGTGVFTNAKYRQLTAAQIECVDYSDVMIYKAKQRFLLLENVSCIQGDVGNLPYPDETFDIVLSMNGFHAFPDKERAFSETFRVLKIGGMFCGCFYIKGENRMTDFAVNRFLSKKGWFTPPFQTKVDLTKKLQSLYTAVNLNNDKGMAYFCCLK